MMLHSHHDMLRRRRASLHVRVVGILVVIIVIAASLVCKVLRSLVLLWSRIVLVSSEDLIDVGGRVLVELLVVSKYDHSHIDRTEDRQLMRLLEQAALALEEGDGAVAIVADGLDLQTSHQHTFH